MLLALSSFIKRTFADRKKCLTYFYVALISILIILCSGNGMFLMQFDSKTRMIVYGVLGLCLFFLTIFDVNINEIVWRLKNRKINIPRTSVLITSFLLFWIALSFIVNGNKEDNINIYVDMFFIVVVSILLINKVGFSTFCKLFVRILFFILVVSLILYVFVIISGYDFASSYFVSEEGRAYGNYLGLLLVLNDRIHGIGGSPRFMSLFWEPGVLGTFLIMGCVCELVFSKKTNYIRLIIFLLGVLVSSSTASIILLSFILAIFISEKIKGKLRMGLLISLYIFALVVIIFFNPIISLLGNLFPTIFSKMSDGSISMTCRIYSPVYYFQVFLTNAKSFFFGFGGRTANDIYWAIRDPNLVDARTSTTGFMVASIGFPGIIFTIAPIVGIFFNKNIKLATKISLSVIFLAVFNKENHYNILCLNIFYFYFLSFIPSFKTKHAYVSDKKTLSLRTVFESGGSRGRFSKNIAGSFFIKILALIVGLVTLPIYSGYFNNGTWYIVWLDILSVISIILYLDFGFGNGMKNKLIDSFSKGDSKRSKEYISNTYFSTLIIGTILLLVFFFVCFNSDVNSFLGDADHTINSLSLKIALFIICASVCVEFVLRNATFVLQAKGRVAIGTSFPLISNILMLVLVFLFKAINTDKFILISIFYFCCINVPLLIANFSLFKNNRDYIPSLKFFSFKKSKEIFSLGIKYFLVQICFLILWTSNTLLISNFLDTSSEFGYVDSYTKYYKVFSLIVTLTSVVSSTIWVNSTDAFIKKDKTKLKKYMRFAFLYALLLCLLSLIVAALLQFVFDYVFVTSYTLTVELPILVTFVSYSIIFVVAETLIIFSNAFSSLKTQLIVSLAAAVLKIPIFILFFTTYKNVAVWYSLVIYNCIYGLILCIFIPIELKHVMKRNFAYDEVIV